MAQRAEIFTPESIDSILSNNPRMKIFEKTRLEGILINFYAAHPLASLEQKISDLEVLKDSHNSRGSFFT